MITNRQKDTARQCLVFSEFFIFEIVRPTGWETLLSGIVAQTSMGEIVSLLLWSLGIFSETTLWFHIGVSYWELHLTSKKTGHLV